MVIDIEKLEAGKTPDTLKGKASELGIAYGTWPAFITLKHRGHIEHTFDLIAKGEQHAEYKGRLGRLVIFAE
jgi:hypothetical protein